MTGTTTTSSSSSTTTSSSSRVVVLVELVLVLIAVVSLFRIISVTAMFNVETEGKSAGRSTCSLILSNYSLLLLHNAYLLIPFVPLTTLTQ
jgi:hypothetical protein